MHPVILQIGGLKVYAYGFFITLAVVAALAVTVRNARSRGLMPMLVLDTALIAFIAGMVGARLFFVLGDWRYFLEYPLEAPMLWEGGMVLHGGLAAGTAAALWFARRAGLDLWVLLDSAAPGLALGIAIGRLGCYHAGCCFGATCTLPWAIVFDAPESLGPPGHPLHPTQLYSSVTALGLFFYLRHWFKTGSVRDGRVFGGFLVIYAVFRFTIELYRADPRGQLLGLYAGQTASVVLFIIGTTILMMRQGARAGE